MAKALVPKTKAAPKAKGKGKAASTSKNTGRQGQHVLFVGNLNKDVTDAVGRMYFSCAFSPVYFLTPMLPPCNQDLKSRFSNFGEVLTCAVQTKAGGASRGFGCVRLTPTSDSPHTYLR